MRKSSYGARVRKEGLCYSSFVFAVLSGLAFLPTKAFTLVCRAIHKHFGGDDITEWQEHLHELAIPKLLREVIDEQVAAFWPCLEEEKKGKRGRERKRGGKKQEQRQGDREKRERGRKRTLEWETLTSLVYN